jgi:hypothetical protein
LVARDSHLAEDIQQLAVDIQVSQGTEEQAQFLKVHFIFSLFPSFSLFSISLFPSLLFVFFSLSSPFLSLLSLLSPLLPSSLFSLLFVSLGKTPTWARTEKIGRTNYPTWKKGTRIEWTWKETCKTGTWSHATKLARNATKSLTGKKKRKE